MSRPGPSPSRASVVALAAAALVAGCHGGAARFGDGGGGATGGEADAGADAGAQPGADAGDAAGPPPRADLEPLQRAYVDLRFGMFIHFGILTYLGGWAQPNLPIVAFNPTSLDAGQWADAALAAHMTFGVLTTKHHDGFALWNSAVSEFDTGSIPWRGGQGDVVREYVDAFRSRGLLPGLYFSVWDTTRGVGVIPQMVTPDDLSYVKAQITELLTGYGPIPILIFDGWSWKTGHRAVPYQEIRDLVKSLQPSCLIMDNTHVRSTWENDVIGVEEALGGAFVPADNTFPATQMQKINTVGGNDWFWGPGIGGLMSVTSIVDAHLGVIEPRWTNLLLNCPPNREGLLDGGIVARLAEVGAAWSPNLARPPLPPQGPQMEFPYQPVAAAATSGLAANAVDGLNNWRAFTVWESEGALPQSITVDLGEVKPDVGMLSYLPRQIGNVGPSPDGAVTSYAIAVSADGETFTETAAGEWEASGRVKVAVFDPVPGRYVRLEARAVNGTVAAATEITVGARR